MYNKVIARILTGAFLACFIAGCGGGSSIPASPSPADALAPTVPVETTWPAGLPADTLQPWEKLDAAGKVIAGINHDSEFLPGVEHVYESLAGVSDDGETAHLESGDVGSGIASWVLYRVLMGGMQPGVASLDVNLGEMSDGNLSSYYVALSNYGSGKWEWRGPFSDSHVRLSMGANVAAGGDYLSDLGNHFITIVAFNGAVCDVVGVSTNAYDAADTEAPPVPTGLFAVPVYGGLDLQWNDVLAGDLAGYRVYYSSADFTSPTAAGVRQVDYLTGQSGHLLTGLTARTYVRVSAVDISGNESVLSDAVSATPLAGLGPALRLGVNASSGLINDGITLTASGAMNYAWDLDGDGIYEITGDTTGVQPADTTRTGLIRPSVRGTTDDGSCVSCAAVSLIIASNSRPAANAYASPTTGNAPLLVTLTGSGVDDDGQLVSYSWDFDGNGTFDMTDTDDPGPVAHTYVTPGLYNAKFRVEDDQGSWDIDTVAVHVYDPANNPPLADLVIGAGEASGDAPHSVHFDASGSSDPDPGDGIQRYYWDLNGDLTYESITFTPTLNETYSDPGIYHPKVTVEDADGDRSSASVEITVSVPGNDDPVADLTASPVSGDEGVTVTLDASGSSDSDGSIVNYEWDYDGDGVYDGYSSGNMVDHTYATAGVFTAKLRVTDDAGAQVTDTASIDVNAPPVADLDTSTAEPEEDELYWLYAEDSNDADGTIVDYEWDLDNDGVFNESGNESDKRGLANVQHSQRRGGYYQINIRVTDDDGSQDTAYVGVTVQGWGYQNVDADGDVGGFPSLALVDGKPAISYYDGANGDLKYVRASDHIGTSWSTPVVVDSAGNVGQHTSLVVVNGRPAISYMDVGNSDVKYVRASDTTGSTWGVPETVDSTGVVGEYARMAVVDGNPAICYLEPEGLYAGNLWYVRSTDATGSSWGSRTSVKTTNAGECGTLLVVDGNPAINYHKGTTYDLMYVRADDSVGAAWGSPTNVVSSGFVGVESTMAIVDGHPAIGYKDGDINSVFFIRADDTSGTSWGTPVELSTGYRVRNVTLAVVGGYPAMAFMDWGNKELRYVAATDTTGTTWGSIMLIDSTSYAGECISMIEIDASPAIAYYMYGNQNLRYAWQY